MSKTKGVRTTAVGMPPPVTSSKAAEVNLSDYKKRNLLSLVTFGAHTECARMLRSHFEAEYGFKTLFVYEYFCTDPIRYNVPGDKPAETQIYAPFLERVLAKREFIAPLNSLLSEFPGASYKSSKFSTRLSGLSLRANQQSYLESEWYHQVILKAPGKKNHRYSIRHEILISDLSSVVLGSKVFSIWQNRKRPTLADWGEAANMFVKLPEVHYGKAKESNHLGLMTGYINSDVAKGDYLQCANADDLPAWLAEYLLVVHPWLNSGDKRVGFIAIPIASETLFFGHIFVLFPPLPNSSKEHPILSQTLIDELQSKITSLYVPCLTLYHNHWAEVVLNEFLEERSADQKVIDGKLETVEKDLNNLLQKGARTFIFMPRDGIKQGDRRRSAIERQLFKLWEQRAKLIDPSRHKSSKGINPYRGTDPKDRLRLLRESLVFRKYLVASPKMIARVQEAMALSLERYGKALACALVVGEAGSGKDQMSQIIKAFSSEFHAFGTAHILNMATLRPRSITAPLLLGLDASSSMGNSMGKVDGWLNKLSAPSKEGWKKTLILDELNSLDMDSQGALLRVFENAEVLPLGGGPETRRDIDVLIIAIMNEDPERLTWQRTIDALRDSVPLVGGVLGELAREYVLRLRRLRDDLYYRLVRGGKIVIPPLRERMEDIPILFYFYVSEQISQYAETEDGFLDINFDVYEYLMDRRFKWLGNIRELQMVAKECVTKALRDYEPQKRRVEITLRHAKAVMDDLLSS